MKKEILEILVHTRVDKSPGPKPDQSRMLREATEKIAEALTF